MARIGQLDRGFGRGALRGPKGNAGATGTSGAPGNGAVFTSLDSLHANPRSVTDWGPIINTAVANPETRVLLLGPYDYPYTTPLAFSSIQGITLQGAAGYNWYDPGADFGYTRLIWAGTTGIAAGPTEYAIDCSSVTTGTGGNCAFKAFDIIFTYSGSWAGGMFNFSQSTFDQLQRCQITSESGASAYVACHLGNVNGITFIDCKFNGYQFQTRGREADTDVDGGGHKLGYYSQYVSFYDCSFSGDGVGITNPGEKWICEGCTFEFPGGTAQHVYADYDYATGSGGDLTLHNCSFWDATGATQYLVDIPSGTPIDLRLDSCHDFNSPGNLAKLIRHLGTGDVILIGNVFTNSVDFGDGTDTASFKQKIVAIGNSCFGSFGGTPSPFFFNIDQGHRHVVNLGNDDLGDNGGNNFAMTYSGLITVARERVDYSAYKTQYAPAVSAHSGATGITPGLIGSDIAGFITLVTAGGSSSAGLLADIAFGHPVPSLEAGGNAFSCAHVVISPVGGFTANGGGAASPSVSAYYAAQPYVHWADASGNTGFQIGVVNAIPSSTTIVLAYRVIQQ